MLAIGFGLFAPLVTRLMLSTPPAFIATLAGLAMLRVLQSAFAVAFQGRFTLGALVTFLVTVAGIPIFNIGAPFWALIAGTLVSLLLERADWREAPTPRVWARASTNCSREQRTVQRRLALTTRRAASTAAQLNLTHRGEPARISMCHCFECQRRTGAVISNQARFRREQIAFAGRRPRGRARPRAATR